MARSLKKGPFVSVKLAKKLQLQLSQIKRLLLKHGVELQ